MNRWLAWACGGIVVVAVLVRMSLGDKLDKPDPTHRRNTMVRPPPTPETSAFSSPQLSVGEMATRPLVAGSLRPPPQTASEAEWKAYRETMEAIRRGRVSENLSPEVRGQLLEEVRSKLKPELDFDKRYEEQLRLAQEREAQARARFQALRESLWENGAGLDPDARIQREAPSPLIGPPVAGIEEKKP